ncbi:MAG: AMP-binding protein [Oligoflexia bacterium]|nr:AMP-binding protein [Oligoflexia bacterium]
MNRIHDFLKEKNVLTEQYINIGKAFDEYKDLDAIIFTKGKKNVSYGEWAKINKKITGMLIKEKIFHKEREGKNENENENKNKRQICGVYLNNSFEFINTVLLLWKFNIIPFCIPATYPIARLKEIIKKYPFDYLITNTDLREQSQELRILKNSPIANSLNAKSATNDKGTDKFFNDVYWINYGDKDIKVINEKIFYYNKEMYPKNKDFLLSSETLENISLDKEAFIMLSSSSNGSDTQKAVVHTFRSMITSAVESIAFYDMNIESKALLSLPLYHVGGFMIFIRALLAGSKLIIPDKNSGIESAIYDHGPDFVSLVSTQFVRLVIKERLTYQLSKMKAILIGGGPTPKWPLDWSKERNFKISLTYGSTEMCSQVTALRAGDVYLSNYSAGKPLRGREIKVNEHKEILIKSETLCKGFLNSEGEIISPTNIDKEGWYRTGDLGFIDDRGDLQILGRKDNIFISGGEKIDPVLVEEKIKEMSWVADAIVVAVPHKEFGEIPWAFVETIRKVPLKKVINFLRDKLPSYMIPKSIIFLDEINEFKGLKYDRKILKEYAKKLVSPPTKVDGSDSSSSSTIETAS